MSVKDIMLASAMVSSLAGGDMPYEESPYLMATSGRGRKEERPKDGKPKTRAVYYYDEKGNLRRKKEKL